MDAGQHRLHPLIAPNSIAIVGASENPGRVGGMPFYLCLQHGFKGGLYPINPKYEEIKGVKCYPDIESVPEAVDLVVLSVPARDVSMQLRRAAAAGARSAIVFASGFAEAGNEEGRLLQQDLEQVVAEIGIPVAGPNCMGFANLKSHAYTAFASVFNYVEPPREGHSVAMVTQSGNICATVYAMARKLGVPFSFVVNTGNEAAVEFSEYLEYFASDPETDAIVGYVEGLRDGVRFRRVAEDLRGRNIPLILLKIGDTEKGAQAVASHTAALAGSHAIYRAAFDELNVIAADDLAHLSDLAYLARFRRRRMGRRVAVLSISGALGALLSDRLVKSGADVPTLSPDVQSILRTGIPDYGMVANPVDLTGAIINDDGPFGRVLSAVLASDDIDMVLLYAPGYLLDRLAPAILEIAPHSEKLVGVIDTQTARSRGDLEAAGVPVFTDCTRAVAALTSFAGWSERSRLPPPSAPAGVEAKPQAAELVRRAVLRGATSLNEVDGKALVACYGAAAIPECAAGDEEAAAAAAAALGYPVAVKVLSADILHKSDIGGVRLNLGSGQAVRSACHDVIAAARRAKPDAAIDGVVVQRQASPGVEVLAGITQDPVFGPSLTVGIGGIFTEIFKDVVHKPLPASPDDIRDMLGRLKGFPLLGGARGKQPCDLPALCGTISAMAQARLAHPEIAEIEMNPIVAYPGQEGVVVLDCLVTLSASSRGQGER